MFNSLISLYSLPHPKNKEKALFSESVSLSSKRSQPLQTSEKVSLVFPLALPSNVFLQYLQVKNKNPMLSDEDPVRLAYTMDVYGSPHTVKLEAPDSPI